MSVYTVICGWTEGGDLYTRMDAIRGSSPKQAATRLRVLMANDMADSVVGREDFYRERRAGFDAVEVVAVMEGVVNDIYPHV